MLFTPAGSFKVEGSLHETIKRLTAEEWPMFVLADTQDQLIVRKFLWSPRSSTCGI